MNKLTKVLGGTLLGALSSTMIMTTVSAELPIAGLKKSIKAQIKPLAVDKVQADLAIMILGSGDPAANSSGRAGSSFLVFADKVPVILMDTGSGSFKTLAQSGANISTVEAFIYTHHHLDHTADMSAMVKSFFFHNLAVNGPTPDSLPPINFYGPDANGLNPGFSSMIDYVGGHYDRPAGLERYLHGFANAFFNGGVFATPTVNLPVDFTNTPPISPVLTLDNGLTVESIPVKHGAPNAPTPSVAYRITYNGKTIVWSGDTDSSTDNMIRISQGADVLIYDTAIMETPTPAFLLQFHTTPTRLGEVASITNPNKLVLAHLSGMTEGNIPEIKATIKAQGYEGPILEGKDLKVINVW